MRDGVWCGVVGRGVGDWRKDNREMDMTSRRNRPGEAGIYYRSVYSCCAVVVVVGI